METDPGMRWQLLGLYEGVADGDRDERTRVLERLDALGVPQDRVVEAAHAGRLEIVWLDELFGASDPARTVSPDDVAARLGVDAETARQFFAAAGLPVADDAPRLATEEEAAAIVELYEAGRRLLPPSALLELTRVWGQAMRRTADTEVHVFRTHLFGRLRDEGVPQSAQIATLQPSLVGVTRLLHPFLAGLHDRHLEALLRSEAVAEAERSSGALPGQEEIVVLFADLAGFTSLVNQEGDEAIAPILERFAAIAEPLAVRHRGTIVKTIGDAYMLTFPASGAGPAAAVRFGWDLVDACSRDEGLPDARAGASCGLALPREGDWYGHTVNLASRVTAKARPGTLVVTEAVRDASATALPDATWSRLPMFGLRGIDRAPRLYRAKRLDAPDGPDGGDGRRRRG